MISRLLPYNFDLSISPSSVLHLYRRTAWELPSTIAKLLVCKAHVLAQAAVTLNKSLHFVVHLEALFLKHLVSTLFS